MATIQGIYIALFERPAHPAGLAYWNAQTDHGADLSSLVATMAGTAEATARFDGLSSAEIVGVIFRSLFDREPDAGGLAHFVQALDSGAQNLTTIAINILDGAQGDDRLLIDNKIAAADLFTQALHEAFGNDAYAGEAAASAGQSYLDGVTTDPASLPSAADALSVIDTPSAPQQALAPSDGRSSSDTDSKTVSVPIDLPMRVGTEQGESLSGGQDADAIFGLGGSDVITGFDGDDYLVGGEDDGHIFSHETANTDNGGPSSSLPREIVTGDVITGGAGSDTFDVSEGVDRVTDFQTGIDHIVFAGGATHGASYLEDTDGGSGRTFEDAASAADDAFNAQDDLIYFFTHTLDMVGGGEVSGPAGPLQPTGYLFADTDRDGAWDAVAVFDGIDAGGIAATDLIGAVMPEGAL